MNIVSKINEQYSQLSQTEKQIVEYVLNNLEITSNMKVQELADATYTSKSTVSRLARKLGFSNFHEMRYSIKQMEPNDIHSQDSFGESLLDHIDTTLKMFNNINLNTLISKILTSNKLYCVGTGLGQNIALEDFARNMMMLGVPIVHIRTSKEFDIIVREYITPNDLVIIVSLSGDTNRFIDSLKLLHAMDVSIVSITELRNNSMAKYAQFNLYFSTEEYTEKSRSITSFTPLFFLLDILVQTVMSNID